MSNSVELQHIRVDHDPSWSAPVVGVIGGLGPAATALFLKQIVALTPAHRDQDHLDLVVLDHSTTPDRTAAILDPANAPDPGPSLARDAVRLQALGAAFIAIPCNTAHHFTAAMQAAADIPLLSIVDVTADAARDRALASSATPRVAVLATDGTRAAGVYQTVLTARGCEVVLPTDEQQRLVMSVIYDGVKAGGDIDVAGLRTVIDDLLRERADVVVLGCTELSVIYDDEDWSQDPRIVDSVESLARATVFKAGRTPND